MGWLSKVENGVETLDKDSNSQDLYSSLTEALVTGARFNEIQFKNYPAFIEIPTLVVPEAFSWLCILLENDAPDYTGIKIGPLSAINTFAEYSTHITIKSVDYDVLFSKARLSSSFYGKTIELT